MKTKQSKTKRIIPKNSQNNLEIQPEANGASAGPSGPIGDVPAPPPPNGGDVEVMVDAPRHATVIKLRYKVKRGKTVITKREPDSSDGDETEKKPLLPEPLLGPPIRPVTTPGYVPSQLDNVTAPLTITKQPVMLSRGGVAGVTKSKEGDGVAINMWFPNINPKQIISTWRNNPDYPKKRMTIDEEIRLDNEMKRKAKDAARLERKRAKMNAAAAASVDVKPEIPGPSSKMFEKQSSKSGSQVKKRAKRLDID